MKALHKIDKAGIHYAIKTIAYCIKSVNMSLQSVALHDALIANVCIKKLRTLLKNSINITEDLFPLHSAIRYRNRITNIVELLRSGADVNLKDFTNETPLHLALRQNNVKLQLIKQLIYYGAYMNEINMKGDSVLDISIKYNRRIKIVRLLLERGALVHQLQLHTLHFLHCNSFGKEILSWALLEHKDSISCQMCPFLKKKFRRVYIKICNELENMKMDLIENNISLYDLVVDIEFYNVFLKHYPIYLINENIFNKYFHLKNIILNKIFTENYFRTRILNIFDSKLYYFENNDDTITHEFILCTQNCYFGKLNVYCLSNIIRYLCKNDLNNFMKAICLK